MTKVTKKLMQISHMSATLIHILASAPMIKSVVRNVDRMIIVEIMTTSLKTNFFTMIFGRSEHFRVHDEHCIERTEVDTQHDLDDGRVGAE